jgi:hypothetical protein
MSEHIMTKDEYAAWIEKQRAAWIGIIYAGFPMLSHPKFDSYADYLQGVLDNRKKAESDAEREARLWDELDPTGKRQHGWGGP